MVQGRGDSFLVKYPTKKEGQKQAFYDLLDIQLKTQSCAIMDFADTVNGWYNKSQRGVANEYKEKI